MAEWAQHWETVNGPVITAVYTGFCFSNLDIHKSLCFLHPSYIGSCVASNEALEDVGRDYSNCGTIGGAGALKMNWAPFAPLSSYITRKLLLREGAFLLARLSPNNWVKRSKTAHLQYPNSQRTSVKVKCTHSFLHQITLFHIGSVVEENCCRIKRRIQFTKSWPIVTFYLSFMTFRTFPFISFIFHHFG